MDAHGRPLREPSHRLGSITRTVSLFPSGRTDLYGALKSASSIAEIIEDLDGPEQLTALAASFEEVWATVLSDAVADEKSEEALGNLSATMVKRMVRRFGQLMMETCKPPCALPSVDERGHHDAVQALVAESVGAFLHNDLLKSAFTLMTGAMGSFGLVLSHSLDATSDIVLAARGQTMSVACYPSQGLVMIGSEAAATKVGLSSEDEAALDGSFRIDLDDVVGEVMLVRWDVEPNGDSASVPGSRHVVHCAGKEHQGTELLRYVDEGVGETRLALGVTFKEEDGASAVQELWTRVTADQAPHAPCRRACASADFAVSLSPHSTLTVLCPPPTLAAPCAGRQPARHPAPRPNGYRRGRP